MLDQAGAHLDEIISRTEIWSASRPESGEAQLLLAKARLARNPEEPGVEGLLRRAVEFQPHRWGRLYQLEVLLVSKHRYEAAADQLKIAVHLEGNQPNPHYHLARVYNRLGMSDLAAEELAIHHKLTRGVLNGAR